MKKPLKRNIDYKCLRSLKEGTFTFVEQWESVEALSDHLASPHFKLFSKESADLAEDMGIKVLSAEELNLYEQIDKLFTYLISFFN